MFAANSALAGPELPKRIDSRHTVVLRGEQALSLANQCSRADVKDVSATWNPSRGQVAEVSRLLAAWLRTHHPKALDDIERRRFQFAGLVSGKRKIIYVNSFIHYGGRFGESWKKEPEIICDGGRRFWGVEFDPATRQFNNMSFNGGIPLSVPVPNRKP